MNQVLVSTLATINTMLSPLAPGEGREARFQVFEIEGPQAQAMAPCAQAASRTGWKMTVERLGTAYFALRVHERSCTKKELGKERVSMVLPTELLESDILDRLPLNLGYVIPNIPADPNSRHKSRVKLTRLAPKDGDTPVRVEWLPDTEADRARPSMVLWYPANSEGGLWSGVQLDRGGKSSVQLKGELSLAETR